MGRIGLTALLLLGALATFSPPAFAESRHGEVNDPQDTMPALSGPRDPDIAQVRVDYDDTGTVSVTVRLYEPFTQTNRFYELMSISVGTTAGTGGSCTTSIPGAVTLVGWLKDGPTGGAYASGYTGSLPLDKTVSADGLETTFTVSSPVFGGQDFRCATGLSLTAPDPDGHCSPSRLNCERIAYSFPGDSAGTIFFGAAAAQTPPIVAAPPAVAACANGIDDDGDGKIDRGDPGCKGDASGASEQDPAKVPSRFRIVAARLGRSCHLDLAVSALPDLKPKKLFPWGPVEVTVTGLTGRARGYKTTRLLPLASSPRYLYRLRPGLYRISGYYPGDAYREASARDSRRVRVSC